MKHMLLGCIGFNVNRQGVYSELIYLKIYHLNAFDNVCRVYI